MEQIQEMKEISEHLKEAGFIVIKKNLKEPYGSGDWNEKIISYNQANKKLSEGYNIAVVCGVNDFICFDCDSIELSQAVESLLPRTYCEQTTSGGYHYFFKIAGKMENLVIKSKEMHYGELRCYRQSVVISPSRAKNKSGKINDYTILQDYEIPYITKEQVTEVLRLFMRENTSDGTITNTKGFEELDSEMQELLLTPVLAGFRSEKEQEAVNKLVSRNFSKEEVFSLMAKSKIGKWNEAPIQYRNMTYEKAIGYVTTQKNPSESSRMQIQVMNLEDYEKYRPPKDFLIQDILFPSESGMIFAPSNHFKSLLVMYMALCIASGKKFLGKFKVKKSPVLILSAEDSTKVNKIRLKQLRKGLSIRRLKIPLHIIPRNHCKDLMNENYLNNLKNIITEKGIKLLIIDTINPVTNSLDDNKARDVITFFSKVVKPLIDSNQVTIIFTHHATSTEKKFLGSVKWKAEVDNVWRIARTNLNHELKLHNDKAKLGETDTLTIKLDLNDKYSKFILKNTSSPEMFSSNKKLSQLDFFFNRIKALTKGKDTTRKEIYDLLEKDKEVKFLKLDKSGKNSSVERAIKLFKEEK